MVGIRFTIKGLPLLQKRLKFIKDKHASLINAMKLISVALLRSIDTNFRQGGRPKEWEELAPLTLALRRKGRGKGTSKILQDKGRLKQSITGFFTPKTAGAGTNLDYAGIHQRGGTVTFPGREEKVKAHTRSIVFGKSVSPFTVSGFTKHIKPHTAKVPKRKFILFQKEDWKTAAKILREYLGFK